MTNKPETFTNTVTLTTDEVIAVYEAVNVQYLELLGSMVAVPEALMTGLGKVLDGLVESRCMAGDITGQRLGGLDL